MKEKIQSCSSVVLCGEVTKSEPLTIDGEFVGQMVNVKPYRSEDTYPVLVPTKTPKSLEWLKVGEEVSVDGSLDKMMDQVFIRTKFKGLNVIGKKG